MKSNPEVVDSRIFSMRSIRCVFWLQKSAFFFPDKNWSTKLFRWSWFEKNINRKNNEQTSIKSANQIIKSNPDDQGNTPQKKKHQTFQRCFFFPPNPPFLGPTWPPDRHDWLLTFARSQIAVVWSEILQKQRWLGIPWRLEIYSLDLVGSKLGGNGDWDSYLLLGGGTSHIFGLFTPIWLGKMNPISRAYFSNGLVETTT